MPPRDGRFAKRYKLDHAFSYDEFDDCLEVVDAVYIALPNSMHAGYTIRAARAGVHVLCEKPMAVTVKECGQMIAACRRASVKLMIAYRLHFEALNLEAIDLARKGLLGALKFFNSSFSMTVSVEISGRNARMAAVPCTTSACTASMPPATCFARSRPRCRRCQSTAAWRRLPRSTKRPPRPFDSATNRSPRSSPASMRPTWRLIGSSARKATSTPTLRTICRGARVPTHH